MINRYNKASSCWATRGLAHLSPTWVDRSTDSAKKTMWNPQGNSRAQEFLCHMFIFFPSPSIIFLWLLLVLLICCVPLVEMAVCQNLVPLVNIKIAGKWMFIPLKMVLIGIDPYPNDHSISSSLSSCVSSPPTMLPGDGLGAPQSWWRSSEDWLDDFPAMGCSMISTRTKTLRIPQQNLRYFGKNKKTSVFDWRPRVLILNPYLTRT